MSILLKVIYRFNAIPTKIPMNFFFFSEIEKPTLQFTWNFKGAEIDKTVLKKKNKTGGLTFPYFKTYYKAIAIKVQYWHKDRSIDQQNKIESPEINLYIYDQIIFIRVPSPFNGKKTVFSTNAAGNTGYLHAKRKKKKNEVYPLLNTTYKN